MRANTKERDYGAYTKRVSFLCITICDLHYLGDICLESLFLRKEKRNSKMQNYKDPPWTQQSKRTKTAV